MGEALEAGGGCGWPQVGAQPQHGGTRWLHQTWPPASGGTQPALPTSLNIPKRFPPRAVLSPTLTFPHLLHSLTVPFTTRLLPNKPACNYLSPSILILLHPSSNYGIPDGFVLGGTLKPTSFHPPAMGRDPFYWPRLPRMSEAENGITFQLGWKQLLPVLSECCERPKALVTPEGTKGDTPKAAPAQS